MNLSVEPRAVPLGRMPRSSRLSASWCVLLTMLVLAVPPSSRADEGWRYRLTPYAWFAGVEGEVGTLPGAPAAPIDIPFKDVVDDVEGGLLFIVDARRGRHGVFADLLYADLESDAELLPPPIGLVLNSTTEILFLSLAYQYAIYEQGDAVADVLVGARYWSIDTRLRFGGGAGLLAGRQITQDEAWIDPVIGVKGRAPLGDSRFYVGGGAGIGGFGLGSDLFYELTANVGYQWNKAIGTAVGYRFFDVDYDDGGFLYDVSQQGWQIGLTWAF